MEPNKRDVFNRLLALHDSLFIHINPKLSGVGYSKLVIPKDVRTRNKNTQIVFQIGYNMEVPIPDLLVGDYSVSGTLSFKGVPFHCTIPWATVFAIVGPDQTGNIWEKDAVPGTVTPRKTASSANPEGEASEDIPTKKSRKRKKKETNEAPNLDSVKPVIAPVYDLDAYRARIGSGLHRKV